MLEYFPMGLPVQAYGSERAQDLQSVWIFLNCAILPLLPGLELRKAVHSLKGASHVCHMLGCFASGFMSHSPQINSCSLFKVRVISEITFGIVYYSYIVHTTPRKRKVFAVPQVASGLFSVFFNQRRAQ